MSWRLNEFPESTWITVPAATSGRSIQIFDYSLVSLARRAGKYFAHSSKPAARFLTALMHKYLAEETRQAWGRLHPSNMGGEYLPPLRKGEVEIARISIASVTADQISVRARRVRERVRYRIVDEYDFRYVCHPAGADAPLSLGELIALMESASDGASIIFPILAMNSRDSISDDRSTLITVSSDFYADLGRYYRALTDAFVEVRTREDAR
jgi:hypothetical protein